MGLLGGRDYIGPTLLVRVRQWPWMALHVGQAAGCRVDAEGCVGIVRTVAVVRGAWARGCVLSGGGHGGDV